MPNGTVFLYDGTTLIGSAALNASGNATLTTALLSSLASPHSITANFAGNADFSASMTSSAVSQTVNPARQHDGGERESEYGSGG